MARLNKKVLVLFSGGMDSAVCLKWAMDRYERPKAIIFDYGQKHSVEINQARRICRSWNVPYAEVDIKTFGHMVDSGLVDDTGEVDGFHKRLKHLPASYVPNRNALFLTLAHAYAQRHRVSTMVFGASQTDDSGYPDCRKHFINGMEAALNIGSDSEIAILAPLLNKNKADIFKMAYGQGILQTLIEETHTCYNGIREKHDWGYGCGECPSCKIRKEGWSKYRAVSDH